MRGVILLGSRAQEGGADPLSDVDLMVITTQRGRLSSLEWLESMLPEPLFSFTYRSPIGGQSVSQAIYEGPLVVDIALVSRVQALSTSLALVAVSRFASLRRVLPEAATVQLDAWRAITSRGAEVLLDKDGLSKRMVDASGHHAEGTATEEEFLNTVHSFFGLTLWESKQLARGELWMGLGTVDQQVKQCLLAMFEWHTISMRGGCVETWYCGRHVQEWADGRWTAALPQTWPSYDVDGAWEALSNTLELFSAIAEETAQSLGYRYPVDEELRVRSWIADRRPAADDPKVE